MTTVSAKIATTGPGPAFSTRERGTGRQGAPHPGPTGSALDVSDLQIGPLNLAAPVVLAPMAGITNTASPRLCREYGGGLYVSEMVTARALVKGHPESMRISEHHED